MKRMILISIIVFTTFTFRLFSLDMSQLEYGIVKIRSTDFDGKKRVGTGFIIKKAESMIYIMTTSHVIEGDPKPLIEFKSNPGNMYETEVLHKEKDSNGIAILIVKDKSVKNTFTFTFNDYKINKGLKINTIGFPRTLGTGWVYSTGEILSVKEKEIVFNANVDEGNSGGPLLDDNGKVIGLITSTSNYGFALRLIYILMILEGWEITGKDDYAVIDYEKLGFEKIFQLDDCRIEYIDSDQKNNILVLGTSRDDKKFWVSKYSDNNLIWKFEKEKDDYTFFNKYIPHEDNYIFTGLYGKNKQPWVAEFDQNGNFIKRIFVGEEYESIYSIINTKDNGYIMCGKSILNHKLLCGKVWKFDKNDNLEWSKLIYEEGKEIYYQLVSICQLNDESFVSIGLKGTILLIVKMNKNGDIIWEKTISYLSENYDQNSVIEEDKYIIPTNDGGFIIAFNKEKKIKVLKFDKECDISWEKEIMKNEYTFVTGIYPAEDNDVYLIGITGTANKSYTGASYLYDEYSNLFISKFNNNGKQEWLKEIGEDFLISKSYINLGENIHENNDGKIVITGKTEIPVEATQSTGAPDFYWVGWQFVIDKNGNVVFEK